jgi:hypothetical protein
LVLSVALTGLAAGFNNTIDRCQPTSLTCPTTFADVRETSPTSKCFRAFTKTHYRHVVLPFSEKLLTANIQFFANNISLRLCSGTRPSLQSPVVRSERSQTEELLRFAFATTCQFTKSLIRTYQRLFRPAPGRSLNLPLIRATTVTGQFC